MEKRAGVRDLQKESGRRKKMNLPVRKNTRGKKKIFQQRSIEYRAKKVLRQPDRQYDNENRTRLFALQEGYAKSGYPGDWPACRAKFFLASYKRKTTGAEMLK